MICRLCSGRGRLLADDAANDGEPCFDCWVARDNGDEVFILVGAINGPPPEEGPWWESLWAAWTDLGTSE